MSRTGEELSQFMIKRYGRALDLTSPDNALAKAARAAGAQSAETPLSKSILNPMQRMWNTGLSHILVQLAGQQEDEQQQQQQSAAGQQQLQTAMAEAIFKAHFEQGLNISDVTVLTALAEEVGVIGAAAALSSATAAEQVASFHAAAKAEGAAGVPFFTVKRQHYPGKFRFCGAQPPTTFMKAFQKLLLDRSQLVTAIKNKVATAAAEAEAAAVSALLSAAAASSPTDEQLAVVESFKYRSTSAGPYSSSAPSTQQHRSLSPPQLQIDPAFRPLKKRQRLSEDTAAAVVQQQQQQQQQQVAPEANSSGDAGDIDGYYQYGHVHTGHHGEQLHHEAQQKQQQQRRSSYSRQMFTQQQGFNINDDQLKCSPTSSSGMPERASASSPACATITVSDDHSAVASPSSCTVTSTAAATSSSTATTQAEHQQQPQQQQQQQGWFLAGMRHLS
jgi:predicted DsbA family dithiol-disulfide isomerase